MVRGTFSPARAWRLAVGPDSTRTLGVTKLPMPNLIVLFGPPAVGKAAVGHELAILTGYRFLHNHLTADPAAALFGWGGERFGRMVHAMRELLLIEAAADASIPGVIFTYVWDLDCLDETETMERYASHFRRHGGSELRRTHRKP